MMGLATVRRSIVLALGFVAAAPAVTQSGAPVEGEIICIGGPRWQPTREERRRLEVEPVPPGFRAQFESTSPCTRWALDEATLIDEHLAHGNQQSATAALAYLEHDYTKDAPAVGEYLRSLQLAWQAALPDLDKARTITQPEGLTYSVAGRFMDGSASIRRLRKLVEDREGFLFLAREYMRVAERFSSPLLLAKAERFVHPVTGGAELMAELGEQPQAERLHFNPQTFRSDDLRMRAAVLRAQLSGDAGDIAQAEATIASFARPTYLHAAEGAFSGGGGFCDVDDGHAFAKEVEQACRGEAEGAYQERVTSYWINRAALDLIARPGQSENVERAMRLLELERSSDYQRCCRLRVEEDIARLRRLGSGQQQRPEGSRLE